ncbi:MAG TPA: HEAT repeat domain-containing protein [Candidatus Binataceae bacterium]|nr:HEAT repeat domain-containing protein [Candidatus Binataceae bacterium]
MAKTNLFVATVAAIMLTTVVVVSAKTTVESKTTTIEQMVTAGKIADAVQKLKSQYKFDTPAGLEALRGFSLAVLHLGLNESDPFEKCYVASALGANGDQDTTKILEAAFVSPDPGLKMAAIDGLGDMNNGIAAAALERLYHSADAYGKRLLVQGLGQLDDPQAMAVLVTAAGESDNDTRLIAVEALGRLHDTNALPQLHQMLATEQQPYNQIMLAHSMLLLGDNSGTDLLLKAASTSTNIDYRAAAIMALADARDASIAEQLKKMLADPELEVRMAAAAALTHYNDDEGLPVLRTAMESQDSRTRSEAGQLLEHLNYNIARSTVFAALNSSDQSLRMSAIHVLGTSGGEAAVEPLTNILRTDPDPIMRADVAWGLGRISSPKCIDPLLRLVTETDPAVRYTAADALTRTANHLLAHRPPTQTASKGHS